VACDGGLGEVVSLLLAVQADVNAVDEVRDQRRKAGRSYGNYGTVDT